MCLREEARVGSPTSETVSKLLNKLDTPPASPKPISFTPEGRERASVKTGTAEMSGSPKANGTCAFDAVLNVPQAPADTCRPRDAKAKEHLLSQDEWRRPVPREKESAAPASTAVLVVVGGSRKGPGGTFWDGRDGLCLAGSGSCPGTCMARSAFSCTLLCDFTAWKLCLRERVPTNTYCRSATPTPPRSPSMFQTLLLRKSATKHRPGPRVKR